VAQTQKVSVVQGDNNIKLVFNIKKDNNVETILGATIDLQFANQENGITIKRKCTITEPTSGECMYFLTSEDTSVPGAYVSELTITYANGTKLTYLNPLILVVKAQMIPD
jgi:hypothetical protein